MVFAIIARFSSKAVTLRPQVRPAHLDHLRQLVKTGRMVLAGPFVDASGGLIVGEFPSEAEAIAFANNDPYMKNGVFERVEVEEMNKTFPE